MGTMKKEPTEIRAFCEMWRNRLLARHSGRTEKLSEEEFGQLVALNTVIYYIDHP